MALLPLLFDAMHRVTVMTDAKGSKTSYTYDATNRMVDGRNKAGEASLYTFNGLGVRVGTEQIVKDNTYGFTDFHCDKPTVDTGIKSPEVVKTDYVVDYTRLDIDQRVLAKNERGEGGYSRGNRNGFLRR